MENWKNCIVNYNASIMEALSVINRTGQQTVMVTDEAGILLGIVSDGDVRRAILKGTDLNGPVTSIMNGNPITVHKDASLDSVRKILAEQSIHHIPVVDKENKIVDLVSYLDVLNKKRYDNPVVLMAGGLGTRLQEYTKDCPKPLLKVGNKPILETIIENMIDNGFHYFFISVNYKADMIIDYLGTGEKYGVSIDYIRENVKLGTAGALSLMKKDQDKPLIVMNGDVLTKLDFGLMLGEHEKNKADATMAVWKYEYNVPYGVIREKDNHIISIDEKPVYSHLINAGIYVLNPDIVNEMPQNEYCDMSTLFDRLCNRGLNVMTHPIDDYWIDIGRKEDFVRASSDYNAYFDS